MCGEGGATGTAGGGRTCQRGSAGRREDREVRVDGVGGGGGGA